MKGENAMNRQDAMKKLESMGTAQNRKVYTRHGVGEKQFGVSFGNLRKLAKEIKVDHGLARELWKTGNHDARVLATMVADPAKLTATEMDAWARDLDNYVVSDAFAGLVARSPHARKKAEKWGKHKGEWMGHAGWHVLAHLALEDKSLSDADLESHLATIEKEIHDRKNYTRYAMNGTLIAIGMRSAKLEKKALAAAKRIGKVEVDHGLTGCKTPDAAAYIKKGRARRAAKKK